MLKQQRQPIHTRQLSSKNTVAYFSSEKFSGAWGMLLLGIVVVIGFVFLVNRFPMVIDISAFFLCFLWIIGCAVCLYKAREKKLSDDEYDSWLSRQASILYQRELNNLGIYNPRHTQRDKSK